MSITLGPEYDELDLDLKFCRRDWEIIIRGLKVLSASTEDKKLSEDANTIRAAIIDKIVKQSKDEEDDIDWREAYGIARRDLQAREMDDKALVSLGCFMDQAGYDAEEARINWRKESVDHKLAIFRDQYAEINSKIYSAIECAVIHFEDLL